MIEIIRKSLEFMTRSEKQRYGLYLFFRAVTAWLDLAGILAIGFLATSMAFFITNGSDASRKITLGPFQIPAVNANSITIISGLILGLFLFKAFFSILLTQKTALFLANIEAKAARTIAMNALGRGSENLGKTSDAEILHTVQTGSQFIFNNLLNSLATIASEGFLFLLVLGAFWIVSPDAALASIAYFGAVGGIVQFYLGRRLNLLSQNLATSQIETNSLISDFGAVAKESKVLGVQSHFFSSIYQVRKDAAQSTGKMFVLLGMPRYIIETALILIVSIFLLFQIQAENLISASTTIAVFLSGGLRLTASLLPLQSAFLSIKQASPHAKKSLKYLLSEDRQDINSETLREQFDVSRGASVAIVDLSYKYEKIADYTIKNISIEVSPGSQIAFIGPSGAGKSTLADIILGLLKPSLGSVRVANLEPEVLTKIDPGILGYVPQNPGMVSGTIFQNIALGVEKRNVDRARLEKAISDAHLKPFIDSLPDGLDTDVGKRKDEFSGGQLQRIGLARALYTQPKLLVLDEATSSLDADSENEINAAIEQMRGHVTVILIAHRLNTIQSADKVYLIENGTITASGTFFELQKNNETVKRITGLMSIDVIDDAS